MEVVKKSMLFQSLVVFFFFRRWLCLCLKNKFQEEFLLEFHFHISDLLCTLQNSIKAKGKSPK